MRKLLQLSIFVFICIFLQGCILLLPVIEKNQEQERLEHIAEKSCPLTDGLGLDPEYKFGSMAEAQAFVAAHQHNRKAKRRVRIKPQNQISSLVKQLKAGTEVARTHAATDLGLMGSKAASAIPALSNTLRYDESKWVRRAAVKSLAKISGKAVLAPLTFALRDSNQWVAHSAKNALRKVRRNLGTGQQAVVLKPVVYRAN